MFKHVHRSTVSNQTQCGTVWYKKVQDGTIKCRMVQRLKHQIVESKTKHGKLTKIIWSNFHQCQVVLGSLEQASSIFTFQVFGHLLQQTVVGSVSASCSCPSLYQNSPSIHQILADTKSYSRSQMVQEWRSSSKSSKCTPLKRLRDSKLAKLLRRAIARIRRVSKQSCNVLAAWLKSLGLWPIGSSQNFQRRLLWWEWFTPSPGPRSGKCTN